MNWKRKAFVQRAFAATPVVGPLLYRQVQRTFGNLRPDPFARLPHHRALLERVAAVGVDAEGARCLEVGTGHLPIVPVAWFLAGAESTVTVDLHRRLDTSLADEMLDTLIARRTDVLAAYDGSIEATALTRRLDRLAATKGQNPLSRLDTLGVQYAAPADARTTGLPSGSIDVHFSVTVLEHVTPEAIAPILAEAHRILRPGGVAVHFVDTSDHFAQSDASISSINFLSYDQRRWNRLAGNQFAYHNRLRASDHAALFRAAGLQVQAIEPIVDQRALTELDAGFPLDRAFARYDAADLAASGVWITALAPVHQPANAAAR